MISFGGGRERRSLDEDLLHAVAGLYTVDSVEMALLSAPYFLSISFDRLQLDTKYAKSALCERLVIGQSGHHLR